MTKIKRDSLMTLEAYHKARPELRKLAIEERRKRTVSLGDNLNLIFENELLMRYQIQEMMRVEKLFDDESINDEIAAYDPLVPDGSNFKATMMIEYSNEQDRKDALRRLVGIEHKIFIQVTCCFLHFFWHSQNYLGNVFVCYNNAINHAGLKKLPLEILPTNFLPLRSIFRKK